MRHLPAAVVLILASASALAEPTPLIQAHAHNDYEHKRPLLDALERGFCSVEADVHLVGGELLVAHSRLGVRHGRTLQALYLDPLRERVRQNGGRVYPNGPGFTLLIEFKGDWQLSYPVLQRALVPYRSMLTVFRDGVAETNAITVVITGHRSRQMFKGEPVRYVALDGDLADLGAGDPATLIPWISSAWGPSFKWRGVGAMPDAERLKLREIVAQAHAHGRRVRFYGAPDSPAFWRELLSGGVDLLNTDDLAGLQRFLTAPPLPAGGAN
jgi:hypothetical protein